MLMLGPAPKRKIDLSITECISIIGHLQCRNLTLRLHQYTAVNPPPNSIPLPTSCWNHHYAVVRSKRYLASQSAKNPRSSLVEVELQGIRICGELTQVLSFDEELGLGGKRVSFGFVKWFYPYVSTQPTVWDTLYVPCYNLLAMLLTDRSFPV